MPPKIASVEIPRLVKRLTADEWAVERVHLLLRGVESNCQDLAFGFAPFYEAAADSVAGGVGWVGLTSFNKHEQHERTAALETAIEHAYEQFGELCNAFYHRLGPGGDLVSAFSRFTKGQRWGYKTQVLWRAKDLCEGRPGEFGPSQQHNNRIQLQESRRTRAFWGDY